MISIENEVNKFDQSQENLKVTKKKFSCRDDQGETCNLLIQDDMMESCISLGKDQAHHYVEGDEI